VKQDNYNVVIVIWAGGLTHVSYAQRAANTRTVGAEVSLIADNLIAKAGSDRSRLYCIGHSLGAHACGHAGMRTKFGRITGMSKRFQKYKFIYCTILFLSMGQSAFQGNAFHKLYSKNNIDDVEPWVINLLYESILLRDHNLICSGLDFLSYRALVHLYVFSECVMENWTSTVCVFTFNLIYCYFHRLL
jgi:hypothetical protein